MPHVTTHRASLADMPQLLEMVQGLAAYHGDRATLIEDDLTRGVLGEEAWMTVFLAKYGEVTAGYTALLPTAQLQFGVRGLDVHHLFVIDAHRGQGIGRALMDVAVAHAKARGCRYLTVGTARENTDAHAAYTSLGLSRRPPSGPRFSLKW